VLLFEQFPQPRVRPSGVGQPILNRLADIRDLALNLVEAASGIGIVSPLRWRVSPVIPRVTGALRLCASRTWWSSFAWRLWNIVQRPACTTPTWLPLVRPASIATSRWYSCRGFTDRVSPRAEAMPSAAAAAAAAVVT